MPTPPQAVIIAGSNGSGKSTAATELLPPGMKFINADMIAQELSGVPGTAAEIDAGRVLIERIGALEKNGEDFAFETTLATKGLAKRVASWRGDEYTVHLIFFWLPSDDLAVNRVAGRVRDGGHHVPEETVRRRFFAGLRNFFSLYQPLVQTWRMYDNSTATPELIARGEGSQTTKVNKPEIWGDLVARYGP